MLQVTFIYMYAYVGVPELSLHLCFLRTSVTLSDEDGVLSPLWAGM